MNDFQKYRRKQIAELRPYIVGESMDGVSISAVDKDAGSPKEGDMIARNPKNHADMWLVARQYFLDNFEPIEYPSPPMSSNLEIARELREIQYAMRLTQQYNRDWKDWHDRLEQMAGRLESAPAQEPVATLNDDGHWTWKNGVSSALVHASNYAGWRMEVYAAPVASIPASECLALAEKCFCFMRQDMCPCADELRALCDRATKGEG